MYFSKNLPAALQTKSTPAASVASASTVLPIQCKLTVGATNDPVEQEANAMADRVVSTPASSNFIQTKPSQKHFGGIAQTNGPGHAIVHDNFARQIISSENIGAELPAPTRSFMESRFQTNFSGVRIHTGAQAVQLSRKINAQAFTVGNNIYFDEGKFAPDNTGGQHLLAHELTHTIQQGGVPSAIQKEEKPDKTYAPKPEVDFKLLPPDLQIRLFHFLVQADTSTVHLDYETRSFMASLSYSYGDALSLKMRFSDFTTKLGWKPTDNTFSLGVGGAGFNAGLTASPFQSKYGLNLTYGAPLLPMIGHMSTNFNAGGSSAGNMMTGLPGLASDPIGWYKHYKADIENISKSVDLVKDITKAGKSKIKFGAGFSLAYDPVSELVIGGRAGFMF